MLEIQIKKRGRTASSLVLKRIGYNTPKLHGLAIEDLFSIGCCGIYT